MAKITKGMVEHLNDTLKEFGVGFMYKMSGENSRSPVITITVVDPVGFLHPVYTSIINCSDTYYEWLDKWFLNNYGITLTYNNTRSCCWSDDFSD